MGGRGRGVKGRNLATLRVLNRFNNVDFHPDIPASVFFRCKEYEEYMYQEFNGSLKKLIPLNDEV